MKGERRFTPELHRPEQARDEMRRELEFHLEERVARLVAKGMTPEGARAEAKRRMGAMLDELGSSAERKERKLKMRDWIEDFVGDVRYAIRGLARQPVFTAIAVGTLALAIGGNTAIYSAVDALILRALPFEQPSRLMDISVTMPEGGDAFWSWPRAKAYRDAQKSFAMVATYAANSATLTGENPERITAEVVSADYLRVLGVRVARGRDFPSILDAGPGVGAFAVITDDLRRRHFAGTDPVGQRVALDRASYEVLGVLPPGFRGISGSADVLVNVTSVSPDDLLGVWNMEYAMVGRLKPGISPELAAAETREVGVALSRQFPIPKGTLTTAKNFDYGAGAKPLDAIRIAPGLRTSLYVLFAAVGMVLLIACANLANLLLARAATRRREIAVRLAIGGSRGRLLRLFMTESLVLASLGGAAGLVLAAWAARALATMNPASSLRAQGFSGGIGAVQFSGIRLDGSAIAYAVGVTLLAALLFGLTPAIGATRADLNEALKDDGSASGTARRGWRLDRRALVVAEVALSIVLLAGSGLMLRSVMNLMRVDPGFRAENVLTLRLEVPQGSVSPDSMPGFYDALRERLGAIPGVKQVALADCPPLAGGCNGTVMTFPDRPMTATNNMMVGVHWVSPSWFGTMDVPLVRGRLFDATDRRGGEKVVLINEAAAKKYFPGENPVGRKVAVYQGGFNTGATVIGVVGDVRFGTLTAAPRPDAYISYGQSAKARAAIFLRTTGDPAAVTAAARAAMHEVAPFSPVFDARLMKERVASASSQTRLSAGLLIAFAAMALILAVMGTYGVMAFAVTQRTREVGIRVALGADRGNVLRMFTIEGLTLAGIGTVLGLAGAFAATRLLTTMLYGVKPGDPVTFVWIALVAIGATLLASWVPARRAAALDPVKALK